MLVCSITAFITGCAGYTRLANGTMLKHYMKRIKELVIQIQEFMQNNKSVLFRSRTRTPCTFDPGCSRFFVSHFASSSNVSLCLGVSPSFSVGGGCFGGRMYWGGTLLWLCPFSYLSYASRILESRSVGQWVSRAVGQEVEFSIDPMLIQYGTLIIMNGLE